MPSEDPGAQARDFDWVLREHIREELRNFHTTTIGTLERIDRDEMTADVAPKHDPGAVIPDVPIAVPFAVDGVGDLPPLRPEDDPEGLLIHTDTPLDDGLLDARGPQPDTTTAEPNRVDDAIWLPAMLWYDSDAIPQHNQRAAERTVAHPDGPELRLHTGRTMLAHGGDADHGPHPPPGGHGAPDTRIRLRLTSDPYGVQGPGDDPTLRGADQPAWPGTGTQYLMRDDPVHAYDEFQLWPRASGAAAALEHPSGTHVTLTRQGVGVVPGETAAGTRQRGLYCGALSDPDRVAVRHHRHELREHHHPVTDEGVTASGDGSTTTVTLPHSLGDQPGHVDVTARSAAARGLFHVETKTDADVTLAYETAPPDGTDNLVYDLLVHPPRDADDDVTLTTAPLTRREQTARLTDDARAARLTNAAESDVQAATTRAENHRAFLDLYAGPVDPTDEAQWPDVEHVPGTAEWAAWDDAGYDPLTFEPPDDPTGVDIGDGDPDPDAY